MGIFLSVFTLVLIGVVFFVVPPAEGLGDYVRLAFFHIPVAWVSVLAFLLSAFWGAKYLRRQDLTADAQSAAAAQLGFVFVILATVSGAVFSKLTWGAYWNWDPRQTTIFVLLLIYGAYLTLRGAMPPGTVRAKTAAVYSLFAFLTVPFLVFIIPRLYFSLHPSPVINGTGLAMDGLMLAVLLAALADMTGIFCYLLKRRAAQLKAEEEKA